MVGLIKDKAQDLAIGQCHSILGYWMIILAMLSEEKAIPLL